MKNFHYAIMVAAWLSGGCANINKETTTDKQTTQTDANKAAAGVLASGLYMADMVIQAPGHTGTAFYDSSKAVNGIRGAGTGAGSLDVFSLDNSGASSYIVLGWSGRRVKNGPGMDFIVFENGFYFSGNSQTRFMDLAFVEVSNDNINYCGFAPVYTNAPQTSYSNDPSKWARFAGKTPVLFNIDTNNLTAAETFQDLDSNGEPDLAGGDGYDLSGLSADNSFNTGCTIAVRDDLMNNGFTYLRLTPASRRNNPATAAPFVADGASNGPDFDGVLARYVQ